MAFKALLSARLCAAIWSNISDCDETFNYWEPTHYLMYGTGFQTWEYSPSYAIRSYCYLLLHAIPGLAYVKLLQPNKIFVFYFLRCILGFCCALCEVYFYRGVCKQFGPHIGRLTLCFQVLSAGFFIASTAYLPSTFAMYMAMLTFGAWYLNNSAISILCTAISVLVGWPFAGILSIPIIYDLLFRRYFISFFVKNSVVAAVIILIPLISVDSHYYGKLVLAPLNIVIYNVFNPHGSELYGVEPWSFYFINGFLNFNFIFVFSLIALPFLFLIKKYLRIPYRGGTMFIPPWLSLLSLYIWIFVFFIQPHKEERFLFPIYPLFCLNGAISVDCIQKVYSYIFAWKKTSHYLLSSNWIAIVLAIITFLISLSRIFALYKGYHAPLDVFMELNKIAEDPTLHTLPSDKHINVCVGKEWYRFPSNFFLPANNWHLQFIQSEFQGQLPKPYSGHSNATRIIPSEMNNQNLEETSRYVDIRQCHYLIDLDLSEETEKEPRFASHTADWKVILSSKFLNVKRSHRFFRAFYVPWLSEAYTEFDDYVVLKTRRVRAKKSKIV